jgi:hypothetical protein
MPEQLFLSVLAYTTILSQLYKLYSAEQKDDCKWGDGKVVDIPMVCEI